MVTFTMLARFGEFDLSDGVPLPLDDDSERRDAPAPTRKSIPLDDTIPSRRPYVRQA